MHLLLSLALLAAEGERPGMLLDRIVAIVDGDIITLSEVEAGLAQALEVSRDAESISGAERDALLQEVLDQLISERLIAQRLESADITISETDVERAIEDILRQNQLTEVQLQQALSARGMSMSEYRRDLKTQLRRLRLIEMNVRSKVSVSEKEVQEEYERRARLEGRKEFVTIAHVFVSSASEDPLAAAAAARARVVGGEDFGDVAREISEGPTAQSGGDLGRLSLDGLIPELAGAVAEMQPGDVSDPIVTPNGVHIVLLEDRSYEASSAFEELAPKIRDELYQSEMEQKMQVWLEELEAAANVDRRL